MRNRDKAQTGPMARSVISVNQISSLRPIRPTLVAAALGRQRQESLLF